MTEDPINPDYLFENEFCFVTEDGKLYQKDNAFFKGHELGIVEKDDLPDALKKFEEAFSEFKKEAEEVISALETQDMDKITGLEKRASGIDAIGDFEALLSEIENKKKEMEKATEAVNTEEPQIATAEEPETVTSEQPEETTQEVVTDEKSAEPEPVSEEKTVEQDVTTPEEDQETVAEENEAEEIVPEPEKVIEATEEAVEEKKTTDSTVEESVSTEDSAETEKPVESETASEENNEEVTAETTAADDTETGETPVDDTEETAGQTEPEIEVPQELNEYLLLVQKAEELSKTNDWQYTSLEFDNLRHKWSESPAVAEEHSDVYQVLNSRFQSAMESFNERKAKHYEEVNRQKVKNVERKRNLLERLEKIISEKKWHASNEVKGIEKRWENVRLIPADESEQLERHFNELKDVFEQNRVEYLVQRKQKEEDNLAGKMLILDKIENLVKKVSDKVDDWNSIDEEYQELQREWKKVGRVPREKSAELWQRFKELRSDFIDKKLELDDGYRKKIEENKKRKLNLIEEAEALIEEADLAKAARNINKLHKKWKETGPVPRDLAEELWQQFKTASDTFNKKKAENIEVLRQQEKENYQKKLELCTRAEAIQDTENWNEGTKVMQNLMEDWKKVGPVPRRKTRKVWKRFKKAMDTFYQHKREHYKELRNEQKDNLRKKREIIEKIVALGEHEDAQEAVKLVKPLQEEFAKIGFVPLKHKNKIYKHYREACDVVYQRSRANRGESSGDSYSGSFDSESRKQLKQKQAQFSKIRRECDQLQDTILNYSDTKTFIKPNKKGIKLREEIQSKIDAAQKELDEKQDELENLRQEIDEIRNGN